MKHKQTRCGYCSNHGHTKRSCEQKERHDEMFASAIFPQKFKPGELVVASLAPPRWEGEHPRAFGGVPEGSLVVITSEPMWHYHAWGGLYDAIVASGPWTGLACQVYADFIRPTP